MFQKFKKSFFLSVNEQAGRSESGQLMFNTEFTVLVDGRKDEKNETEERK